MKKGLSKLLGITLLCATIISGGALISHLALSRNAENNVVQNNNNNNQSSKLVSAKHKFLTASYDFRNQVNSLRKFKNNDEGDMRSLMNFIGDSNKNVHDEDSPIISVHGSFQSSEITRVDEDTQEEITETVYSYENVYKGNGGLRLGTGSGENRSYLYLPFTSNNDACSTSVKLHVTTYNTVINGVDHYDTVNLLGYGNITGESVIEDSCYGDLQLTTLSGRLIIYQADFYFDYFVWTDFIDIDDVPKGIGYSYESIGSFKYSDVFSQHNSVVLNSETNEIETGFYEEFQNEKYQFILFDGDGDRSLYCQTFDWLVILKDYNYVLYQKDEYLYIPSPSMNLCVNNDSEFYVFRKVTSLDPYGPQY